MHAIIENLFEVINNTGTELEEFRFALSGVHYSAANINEVNEAGESVLFAAILSGNEVMAREIINAGADVTQRTPNGDTILHYVAHSNHDGKEVNNDFVDFIATTLLGYIDLEARNNAGQTALEVARTNSNHSAIAILTPDSDELLAEGGAAGGAASIEEPLVPAVGLHPDEWADYGLEGM